MDYKTSISFLTSYMLDLAKATDLPMHLLVERCDLSEFIERDTKTSNSSISKRQFLRLWGLIQELLSEKTIDDEYYCYLPKQSYKYFGRIHAFANNLLDANKSVIDFLKMMKGEWSIFSIFSEQDLHYICRDSSTQNIRSKDLKRLVEINHVIGLYCSNITNEWLIGRPIPLDRVGVAFDEQHLKDIYEGLFGCKIVSSSNYNYLAFSIEYGGKPIVRNKIEFELICTNPKFVYENSDVFIYGDNLRSPYAFKIRNILKKSLNQPPPTLDLVASELNCSKATLQRKLKSENTSYQEIKDLTRMQHSLQLLSNSEYSINEIADSVGFSNVTAFYRAIKKWTGKNPSEWRS